MCAGCYLRLPYHSKAVEKAGEKSENSLKHELGLSHHPRKKLREQYVQTVSSAGGKCIRTNSRTGYALVKERMTDPSC